jgi:hypothetical protein
VPDDSRVGAKLLEAEQHLRSGNWARADDLADIVVVSEDALPKHVQRAKVVQGVAACARHDSERAVTIVRSLESAPALQRRVLARCHALGLLKSFR